MYSNMNNARFIKRYHYYFDCEKCTLFKFDSVVKQWLNSKYS